MSVAWPQLLLASIGFSGSMVYPDAADILESSLRLIGAEPVNDSPDVHFGPIVVSRPPRSGKANTLLADQVFNPGLVTAEQIWSGHLDLAGSCVLELGCGAGLPSLVAASLPASQSPELVVLTDYPDEAILASLGSNIARNAPLARCPVRSAGYAWGDDAGPLLSLLPPSKHAYDTLILSDLIHLTPPIPPLLRSLTRLLAPLPSSLAYISVAPYTPLPTVRAFIAAAQAEGLVWDEWDLAGQGGWEGPDVMGVGGMGEGEGLGREGLGGVKGGVRGWTVRWGEEALRMRTSATLASVSG